MSVYFVPGDEEARTIMLKTKILAGVECWGVWNSTGLLNGSRRGRLEVAGREGSSTYAQLVFVWWWGIGNQSTVCFVVQVVVLDGFQKANLHGLKERGNTGCALP